MFSMSHRLKKPNISPVQAKERMRMRSNQTGMEEVSLKWNRSVSIYGAFGKNSSQTAISSASIVFDRPNFRHSTIRLAMAQGTNARKRFQFRNRNTLVSV